MSGEGVEGLRTMILSFRISELHSLLALTDRNKSGNKTMLQVAERAKLRSRTKPVVAQQVEVKTAEGEDK